MEQQRSTFFGSVLGPGGHLFNTGNRPDKTAFQNLFDSVTFKLENGDTASNTKNGHVRIAYDSLVLNRVISPSDPVTRVILAPHLPNVKTYADINVGCADSLGTPVSSHGIKITPSTRLKTGETHTGRDFVIENDMTLGSTDSSIVVAEAPAGSKHFDITINTGTPPAWMYTVLTDIGGTPGYLDSVCGQSMGITIAHTLEVKTHDTDCIELVIAATGLQANLLYDTTYFDEVAGTGLFPLITSGAPGLVTLETTQTIAGIKTFGSTVQPRLDVYAVPSTILCFTTRQYNDSVYVHLTGNEVIAGNKTITGSTVFSSVVDATLGGVTVPLVPAGNAYAASKDYVDGIVVGAGLWSVGTGTESIQSVSSNAAGNYSFAGGRLCDVSILGIAGIALGNGALVYALHGIAIGNGAAVNHDYSVCINSSNTEFKGEYTLGFIDYDKNTNINSYHKTTMSNISTDASSIDLFITDSAIQYLTVSNDCLLFIKMRVMATQIGGTAGTLGDSFAQEVELVVKVLGGVYSIIPPTQTDIAGLQNEDADIIYKDSYSDAALTGSVIVTVGAATGIKVTCTGEVDKTIYWNDMIDIDYMAIPLP